MADEIHTGGFVIPSDGQTTPTLTSLAHALNCSVDAFYKDEAPADVEQVAKLIALWTRVKNPAGREHILRILQEEVDKADNQGDQ